MRGNLLSVSGQVTRRGSGVDLVSLLGHPLSLVKASASTSWEGGELRLCKPSGDSQKVNTKIKFKKRRRRKSTTRPRVFKEQKLGQLDGELVSKGERPERLAGLLSRAGPCGHQRGLFRRRTIRLLQREWIGSREIS